MRAAEELKAEGNDAFRAKEWSEALLAYRNALARLPRRKRESTKSKGKRRATPDANDDDESRSASPSAKRDDDKGTSTKEKDVSDDEDEGQEEDDEPEDDADPVPEEMRAECAKARAVLNANIGACYVKLVCHASEEHCVILTKHQGDHKAAVASCTEGAFPHGLNAFRRSSLPCSPRGRSEVHQSLAKTRIQ